MAVRGASAALLAIAGMHGVLAQPQAHYIAFDIVAERPGLTAADLHLTDDHKPQALVYCHPTADSPQVTAVVIDTFYAPVKSPRWIEAIRAMRQIDSSEHLYLYVITAQGAMLPVHGLPSKDASAVPVNAPWMDRDLPAIERALPAEPRQGRSGAISTRDYLDLASRLASFPGRKSLVCIGCLYAAASQWKDGKFAQQSARAMELRNLTSALLDAGVAVYPAGGSSPTGRIGAGNADGGGMPGAPGLLCDEMAALADATGGRAYALGEIGDAIAAAVRDGRSSYRIAYQPSAGNWDGKRHALAISAAGVRNILAPKWYIADAPADVLVPDTAITSPFDRNELGITARLTSQAITASVDGAGLVFRQENGRQRAGIILQLICYTQDQRRQACTSPIIRQLDPGEAEYRFSFAIPGGEQPLRYRVIVRDENSGAVGTATISASENR